MMFSTVLILLLAISPAVDTLQIQQVCMKQVTSPVKNGTWSPGYFSNSGSLAQQGDAKIQVGDMSTMTLTSSTSMTQYPGSVFASGLYSEILFDGCNLNMYSSAQVIPDKTYGAGRMFIFCNSTWNFGEASELHLQPQSLINITSLFSVGKNVKVYLKDHTALVMGNNMVIQDHVVLTMQSHSTFIIGPQGGAVATITSSKNQGANTQVILGRSAVIKWVSVPQVINCDGIFKVGEGTETEMILEESGSLTVFPSGSFEIRAATFEIGPSSYWIIKGSFLVTASGSLKSGLQSNITIGASGSLQASNGGSVNIEAGTSAMINGYLSLDGALTMGPSSQIVVETNAKLTLYKGTSARIDAFGGFRVGESISLIVEGQGCVHVGTRSIFSLENFGPAFCYLSKCLTFQPYSRNVYTNTNQLPSGLLCFRTLPQ